MSHIQTASELLGMTNSDFIDWISSFQPDYKTYISDSGVGCFYTDGDDGLIWFDPDCESFDDEGLRVEVMFVLLTKRNKHNKNLFNQTLGEACRA